MGSSTLHTALIATPVPATRQRQRLWWAAGASTFGGFALLPVALSAVHAAQQLPQWPSLAHAMASAPRLAWWLMLVCLLVLALCALMTVCAMSPRAAGVSLLVGLPIAMVWGSHLPPLPSCTPEMVGCASVQALVALALGSLLSTLLFALGVRLLAHWGWVDMPEAQPDVLDHYRYGK